MTQPAEERGSRNSFFKRSLSAARELLFGYDVFISFASRDALRYAKELRNTLAARDFRCFLANQEPLLGTPLSRALNRALKRSKALILVGSPAALESTYVLEEVRTFAALKRPWLAVDVVGTLRTAVNHPLRVLIGDRLWCDEPNGGLRKISDEVVAAVLLRLDFRRTSQQLVFALSAVVVAFAALSVGLGFVSVQLKRAGEAEARARAAAEARLRDAVDTAEKVYLKINQRLPQVTGTEHIQSELSEAATTLLLKIRANEDPRALHAMALARGDDGDRLKREGKETEARPKFEEAVRLLDAVLVNRPGDVRATRDLAAILVRLAHGRAQSSEARKEARRMCERAIAVLEGLQTSSVAISPTLSSAYHAAAKVARDDQEALRFAEQAVAVARQGLQGSPLDEALRIAFAEASIGLANLLRGRRQYQRAAQVAHEAVEKWRGLSNESPLRGDIKERLAYSAQIQGRAREALGEVEKALESYRFAVAQLELLPESPTNLIQLARLHIRLSRAESQRGNLTAAREYLDKMLARFTNIELEKNVDTRSVYSDLLLSRGMLALAHGLANMADGDFESALRFQGKNSSACATHRYQEGRILAALMAGKLQRAREALSKSKGCFEEEGEEESRGALLERQGDLALALKQYSEARQHFEAERALFEKLAREYPEDLTLRLGIADSLEKLGTVEEDSGNPSAAAGHYRAAVELRRALGEATPSNPYLKRTLLQALVRLARVTKGRDSIAAAEEARALRVAIGPREVMLKDVTLVQALVALERLPRAR